MVQAPVLTDMQLQENGVVITSENRNDDTKKRSKALQACTACKKQKTRCESLDGVHSSRCRRCHRLDVACSFEAGDSAGWSPSDYSEHMPTSPSAYIVSNADNSSRICGAGSSVDELAAAPLLAWKAIFEPLASDHVACRNQAQASLDRIVSHEQMNYLLNIFETLYNPWLNVPPLLGEGASVVNLARCLVASRHLVFPERETVTSQLVQAISDILPQLIFLPTPSTDIILTLIILSMWPVTGATGVAADSDERLRAAVAVSMAENLHLPQASARVDSLRKKLHQSVVTRAEDSRHLEEAENLARMCICLCNVEAILCCGTDRMPISRCSDEDLRSVVTSSSVATIAAGRDTRLCFIAHLLEVTRTAMNIQLISSKEVGRWHEDVLRALKQLEMLHRKISPLTIIAEHEQLYHYLLQLYYYACRLLVIMKAQIGAYRQLLTENITVPPHEVLISNGEMLCKTLAQEAEHCAEGILEVALSRNDIDLLGTAPDHVFHMISLAALFLIVLNFALFQRIGAVLNSPAIPLLSKMVERLRRVARTDDHLPIRSANFISGLLEKWENRSSDSACSLATGSSRDTPNSFPPGNVLENNDPLNIITGGPNSFPSVTPLLVDPTNDFGVFGNWDINMDDGFWTSFMDSIYNATPDGANMY